MRAGVRSAHRAAARAALPGASALLAVVVASVASGLRPTPAQAAVAYTAYVGNYVSGTLLPINTATNTTSSTIAVSSPQAIAITPDGSKAYVCDWSVGMVTPITLATNEPGSPITVGTKPSAIAITPDGTKAYVSNYNNNEAGTVTVITLSDGKTSTIPVGKGPYGIAITPDGTKAYVANHYDGTVTPITIATNTAGTPITVGEGEDKGRTDWIAVSPDGSKAYAANYGTSEIVPITVATNVAGGAIKGVTNPNAIAITPDGATAYIAEDGTPGHVVPMTLSSNTLGTAITVGNNPYDIAITPDQASAYVANYNKEAASVVTPINLDTNVAGSSITAENGPDSVAITPDQAPVASFTVTPGTAGSASSFDASASTVAYGTITSYAWSFGDGYSATTSTPTTTHVYGTAGSYTATVTETDSAGTSMTQVFTGQTVSRNGGSAAQTSRSLTVEAALTSPMPTPMTPASPGTPPSFGPLPAPMPIVISPKSVVTTSSGDVPIEVRCPVTALSGCHGRITLLLSEPRARRARAHAARCARGCRRLGGSNYQARAGQTKRVLVHMASFGRKQLARRRALRVGVVATDVSGSKTATTVLTITLRAHPGHV
jgi:YVTN family beta-propeller protein